MAVHFAVNIRLLTQSHAPAAIAFVGPCPHMNHAADLAVPARDADGLPLIEESEDGLDGPFVIDLHWIVAGGSWRDHDIAPSLYITHPGTLKNIRGCQCFFLKCTSNSAAKSMNCDKGYQYYI